MSGHKQPRWRRLIGGATMAGVAMALVGCGSSSDAVTTHSQPYVDGYRAGNTWTEAKFEWEGKAATTCTFWLTTMPATYPTDNAAHSNQWDQGCMAGLKADPNHPSHSFTDGYNSETRLCRQQGWVSCAGKLASAQPAASPRSWCTQLEADPTNYGGPPTTDNRSQWLQGCIASFGDSHLTTPPPSTNTTVATGSTAPTAPSATDPQTSTPNSSSSQTPPVLTPPTSTTTTTGPPLSGEQQKLVDDLETDFPGLSNAVQVGTSVTAQMLSDDGQEVCDAMTQGSSQIGPSGYGNLSSVFQAFIPSFANGAWPQNLGPVVSGLSIPGVGDRSDLVMAQAIDDLCPAYVGGIPAGDPGAQ
jgi:hypothetical protein